MKNITLKIDDETHLRARLRATEQGISLSAVTRQFLQDYATHEERMKDKKRRPSSSKRLKN